MNHRIVLCMKSMLIVAGVISNFWIIISSKSVVDIEVAKSNLCKMGSFMTYCTVFHWKVQSDFQMSVHDFILIQKRGHK